MFSAIWVGDAGLSRAIPTSLAVQLAMALVTLKPSGVVRLPVFSRSFPCVTTGLPHVVTNSNPVAGVLVRHLQDWVQSSGIVRSSCGSELQPRVGAATFSPCDAAWMHVELPHAHEAADSDRVRRSQGFQETAPRCSHRPCFATVPQSYGSESQYNKGFDVRTRTTPFESQASWCK